MLEVKESEAKLAVVKLQPSWLENTRTFSPQLVFIPPFSTRSPVTHPRSCPPPSSCLSFSSFFCPSVNSSVFYLLQSVVSFSFTSAGLQTYSIAVSSLFTFHLPIPSLLGFLPHCPSDVFLILTRRLSRPPAVTSRPLKSPFPPFSFSSSPPDSSSQLTTRPKRVQNEHKQNEMVHVRGTNSEDMLSVLLFPHISSCGFVQNLIHERILDADQPSYLETSTVMLMENIPILSLLTVVIYSIIFHCCRFKPKMLNL